MTCLLRWCFGGGAVGAGGLGGGGGFGNGDSRREVRCFTELNILAIKSLSEPSDFLLGFGPRGLLVSFLCLVFFGGGYLPLLWTLL